jgi:cAMP phosphodiesterase
MKIQLLPSTIDEDGRASRRQHLLTLMIDDLVAVDAGCLALSCSRLQREQVRDVVLTHVHLDHVAGLPLYIDDLFSQLTSPIRLHATKEMIEILERDLFNWAIYPRFSELANANGPVLQYVPFERGHAFEVKHLSFRSIPVNHKVSANGYIVDDGSGAVAITGDTAETEEFWRECNGTDGLKAVLVECAFPDRLSELAVVSNHLSPNRLAAELAKLNVSVPVYVINIKPAYREQVVKELDDLSLPGVEIMDVGRVYLL